MEERKEELLPNLRLAEAFVQTVRHLVIPQQLASRMPEGICHAT